MSERNDLEAQEGLVNPDFPEAVDVDPAEVRLDMNGFKTVCIVLGVFAALIVISLVLNKTGVHIVNIFRRWY